MYLQTPKVFSNVLTNSTLVICTQVYHSDSTHSLGKFGQVLTFVILFTFPKHTTRFKLTLTKANAPLHNLFSFNHSTLLIPYTNKNSISQLRISLPPRQRHTQQNQHKTTTSNSRHAAITKTTANSIKTHQCNIQQTPNNNKKHNTNTTHNGQNLRIITHIHRKKKKCSTYTKTNQWRKKNKKAPTFSKGICISPNVSFGVSKAVSNSSAENSTEIFKSGLNSCNNNKNLRHRE